jgi:hybrid cluster-associated redox disulfide protein
MLHAVGQRKRGALVVRQHHGQARPMAAFTKDMSIFEALAADPRARGVFESHGMACCLCIGAQSETIEAGAILHQIDPEVVVAELNGLTADEA